jgi:hypothetical protein
LNFLCGIGIRVDISRQLTGLPLFELFDRMIPSRKPGLLFFELLEIIESCRIDKL